MKIAHALFSQGFGTRRECEALVLAGYVTANGAPMEHPDDEVDAQGLELGVRGETWPYHAKALIVLNVHPEMLERACRGLLDHIRTDRGL